MPQKTILVQEYMTRRLTSLSPDTEIMRAVQTLLDNDISGAPVVDGEGLLVGVLTHKDCMKVVLNAAYHSEFCGTVADYMTSTPIVMAPNISVVEAAQQFLEKKFHSYPVVEDGVLVGQISRRDILNALEDAWQWQNR